MTTTQEQAPVDEQSLTDWLIDTVAHCTTGHFDVVMFKSACAHKDIDALRQPQAARLTEEERVYLTKLDDCIKATENWHKSDSEEDFLLAWAYCEQLLVCIHGLKKICNRLTAAPAQQVTGDEIAERIEAEVWFDGPDGTLCGVSNAVKSIANLPALRGLVKEG